MGRVSTNFFYCDRSLGHCAGATVGGVEGEPGYERQDILNLFRFIDWMLELPEGLKQAFRTELEQYEQERTMRYVTSIEQMAKAEGKAEGKAEERLATQTAIALNLLQEGVALDFVAKVTGLTVDQLQQLQSQANH